ncbi:MAG: hypothetical protein PHY47_09560 [Lachnospiraceae bacterium]|nr:hypothetical protein [Lachnospiraceae bacterium]
MDPIFLVISIFIRMVLFVFKMIWMLCKWGFGWMMLGYFLDHYLSGGSSSPSHILFMCIAWGGTFLHFFGGRIINVIKKKRANSDTNIESDGYENI